MTAPIIRNRRREGQSMTIGIIGAMEKEIARLKEALEQQHTVSYSGIRFLSGAYGDIHVVAAVSGIGKVFAAMCAQTMILKFPVEQILHIGVAGTLTDRLGVMDVTIADKVVQHDMDTSPLGDPVGLISGINQVYLPCDSAIVAALEKAAGEAGVRAVTGTIASGDQFVDNEEKKRWIGETFGAVAAEMEGAAVGQVCYVNRIPFGVLRSISDGAGGAMDYETFSDGAARQAVEIVCKYMKAL